MKGLVFWTKTAVEDGQAVTYCGPQRRGKGIRHLFAGKRGSNGHCPGYVYLLALANGYYKIGKVEDTSIQTDDFILDEIDEGLLWCLKNRLIEHQEDKKLPHYNDYVFLHAIRVACGEGGEKHPQVALGERVGPGEMYALSKEDIEAFKNAAGELLGRPIKHVTAMEFGEYLDSVGETRIKIDGRDR
jgi:hypothetical protein